jgi:hypothetical protein
MFRFRTLAVAAALLTVAGLAQAQAAKTDGVYLSLGGGRSDYALDCAGTTACDNSGSALRISGGWRMGTIGFEAVALRFGTAKATVPVSGFGNVTAELKSEMLGGGVALIAPLGSNFDGMVRLGIASVKTSGSGSAGSTRVNVGSERKTAAYAGLGLAWKLAPAVSLEAHWDSTRAEFGGDDGNVSALTLAVGFRF